MTNLKLDQNRLLLRTTFKSVRQVPNSVIDKKLADIPAPKGDSVPSNLDFAIATRSCSGDKLAMNDDYHAWGLCPQQQFRKSEKNDPEFEKMYSRLLQDYIA